MKLGNSSLVALAAYANDTSLDNLLSYVLYCKMLTTLFIFFENLTNDMKEKLVSIFITEDNGGNDAYDTNSDDSTKSGDMKCN